MTLKSINTCFLRQPLNKPLFHQSLSIVQLQILANRLLNKEPFYESKGCTTDIQASLFLNGIRLASPRLYELILQRQVAGHSVNTTPDICASLINYIRRSAQRCTPFGTFASFCTIPILDRTYDNSNNTTDLRIHAFLSGPAAFKLFRNGDEYDADARTLISLNPSMFRIEGRYRWLRFNNMDDVPAHRFTMKKRTSTIDLIVSFFQEHNNTTVLTLLHYLSSILTVDQRKKIPNLLSDLIRIRFIVKHECPSVYLHHASTPVFTYNSGNSIANNPNIFAIISPDLLEQLINSIELAIHNPSLEYESTTRSVGRHHSSHTVVNLHCDMFENSTATISRSLVSSILATAKFIAARTSRPNPVYMAYATALHKRFAYEWVPISRALDTEYGIGVVDVDKLASLHPYYKILQQYNTSLTSFLVSNINFNRQGRAGPHIDLRGLPLDDAIYRLFQRYVRSGYVMFSTLNDVSLSEDPIIDFTSVAAGTGLELISRFGATDTKTADFCRAFRDELNSVCNDNCSSFELIYQGSPKTRDYLIRQKLLERDFVCSEFNSGFGGKSVSHDSILVSSDGTDVHFWDTTEDRPARFELNSAHNVDEYNSNNLYRILANLSRPVLTGFSWPDSLSDVTDFPQVCCGSAILARRRWSMSKQDANRFSKLSRERRRIEFRQFCSRNHIEGLVEIGSGDQYSAFELLNDIDYDGACDVYKPITMFIRELPLATPHSQDSLSSFCYPNEYVVPFINLDSCNTVIKRRYIDHSEDDIYTKHTAVYCRIYSARRDQNIIIKYLEENLINSIDADGIANNWFFVRYHDERGPHLRVRFFVVEPKMKYILIKMVDSLVDNLVSDGYVCAHEYSKYEPEFSRYGGFSCMSYCESIFCAHSALFSDLVSEYNTLTQSNCNRIEDSFLIDTCTRFLNIFFQNNLNDCVSFLRNWKNTFSKTDRSLYNTVNEEYDFSKLDYLHFNDCIEKFRDFAIHKIDGNRIYDIIKSLIHMMANRTLVNWSKGREIAIIVCLERFFSRRLSRKDLVG